LVGEKWSAQFGQPLSSLESAVRAAGDSVLVDVGKPASLAGLEIAGTPLNVELEDLVAVESPVGEFLGMPLGELSHWAEATWGFERVSGEGAEEATGIVGALRCSIVARRKKGFEVLVEIDEEGAKSQEVREILSSRLGLPVRVL